MTNQQLLDDAKAAAFDVHVYEGEYAHHKTEYTFDENGLAKFAELILARQEQPTPSQSDDERAVFESWWFASKYCQVIYHDAKNQQIAWDGWQTRANLSKPQPTSQDVVKIPKSVDEAKAMAIISTNYLKQFAPNELYPPKEDKQ